MIKILITGYIGPAETAQSIDFGASIRTRYIYNTIEQFFGCQRDLKISLLLTGDKGQCEEFFNSVEKNKPTWLSIGLHYFSQSGSDLNRGKGWLELQLIKKFIHKNGLCNEPFLKLSSKYKIENLQQLLSICEASRHSIGWTHLGKNMVDTRAIILTQAALESKYLLDIDDSQGYYLEHAMYDVLTENGKKFLFYKRPIISGLSGSTGSFSRMNYLKKILIQFVTISTRGFRSV